MEPRYELITREIDAKGKGYLILRRCAPPELGEALALRVRDGTISCTVKGCKRDG